MPLSPVCGTRSMVSITRWKRSRSFCLFRPRHRLRDSYNFVSDILRRKNKIHTPACDCALRHIWSKVYFDNGYPYEEVLSSIDLELRDLRTMRSASAHITSSTQTALNSLALRLLGTPADGIDLYRLLTTNSPGGRGGTTVLAEYRDKLVTAAEMIATG